MTESTNPKLSTKYELTATDVENKFLVIGANNAEFYKTEPVQITSKVDFSSLPIGQDGAKVLITPLKNRIIEAAFNQFK